MQKPLNGRVAVGSERSRVGTVSMSYNLSSTFRLFGISIPKKTSKLEIRVGKAKTIFKKRNKYYCKLFLTKFRHTVSLMSILQSTSSKLPVETTRIHRTSDSSTDHMLCNNFSIFTQSSLYDVTFQRRQHSIRNKVFTILHSPDSYYKILSFIVHCHPTKEIWSPQNRHFTYVSVVERPNNTRQDLDTCVRLVHTRSPGSFFLFLLHFSR